MIKFIILLLVCKIPQPEIIEVECIELNHYNNLSYQIIIWDKTDFIIDYVDGEITYYKSGIACQYCKTIEDNEKSLVRKSLDGYYHWSESKRYGLRFKSKFYIETDNKDTEEEDSIRHPKKHRHYFFKNMINIMNH